MTTKYDCPYQCLCSIWLTLRDFLHKGWRKSALIIVQRRNTINTKIAEVAEDKQLAGTPS
jgi:hypothetical protein